MSTSKTAMLRCGGALAAVALALVAAGCGSSNATRTSTGAGAAYGTSSSGGGAAYGKSSGGGAAYGTSTASAPAAGAGAIKTAHGAAGTYLTTAAGRALYLFAADRGGTSKCSGACAGAWPPLLTKGHPAASGGAQAAKLGTTTRAGGARQVTYAGHPLYLFAGDTGPGTTRGEGVNAFGARWWLVAPTGTAITSHGSSAGAPASSSSSGGGGY